ncbi:uncharacterized protein HMPREF1541_04206 [Cyphellophora europaea CBS 101466]|uniref:Uncharacterized protein n=1 Tax=Cyphellophora europaea (strain CBS 101466) TaxID=1220924 RepID=W2S0Z9_CYPE1|nr:uncharacterized protein HMPREF1541_04206 [Cyphellophora europaea CBS 101466]ETN42265.1 hypothetical protein HMPREF1541_04206 [Cyphellophora europaea CBS 101466]
MVLLTSSTVSAVLSVAIISLFTFLLFLVGYVLQQQSVNSLREAIRAPPPAKHTPTLPARFREPDNETDTLFLAGEDDEEAEDQIVQFMDGAPTDPSNIIEIDETGRSQLPSPSTESLAYILALSQPATLCSAALFAQSLSLAPLEARPDQPRLVLLYPSTWETVTSALHMAALSFMRDLHDTYSVIFHPVEFVKGWEDASTNSHLLGELQRTMWEFDRMLYLRTPGMVLDQERVREALRSSSLRKAWTPLTNAVGAEPEMLLWERKRGLLMPRGEMRRMVGSDKSNGLSIQEGESEPALEEVDTAYVLFDRAVQSTEAEKSEVLQRYESGLAQACKGKGLLPGEEDRVDLKRV